MIRKALSLFVLFSCLILTGLLTSCGANSQSEKTSQETVTESETPVESTTAIEETEFIPTEKTNENGDFREAWKGEIDGKIPVTLELQMQDGLAYGSLVYENVGTPIKVIGINEFDATYRLYEFESDGNITGIWNVELDEEEGSGSWFSPATLESMPVLLTPAGQGAPETDLTAGDLMGEYDFSYGKEGNNGGLSVTGFEEGNVFYDLICVTAPPAYHIATVEEGEGVLMGNKIEVRWQDGEYMDCAFDIRFYKDFAVVNYVDEKRECGFGHNAYVDGVFLKTK